MAARRFAGRKGVSPDDPFLDSIFDTPDDDAPRLVYADWLEERGDPRGELLRLRCDMKKLPTKDPRRKKLLRRERVLTASCDADWLVLLERADWKLRYFQLEPTGKHRDRWVPRRQAAISAAIREFEDERGLKLPRSYKAFAHVFGPGEMGNYFRICVPCVDDDYGDLLRLNRNAQTDDYWAGDHKRDIFLAVTISGEAVVWDTADITDAVASDYRVYWLNRNECVYRTAETFDSFIDEMCLKVFDAEDQETPQVFGPY